MIKTLACFAVLGALLAFAPAPASAASTKDGVQTTAPAVTHDEVSAQYRYRYRPYRYYKPYRYYARPRYYYRPRYYRYY